MRISSDQLQALRAVIDHKTFEAAARALCLTPSAVSQRIRALESHLGQVVVVRATPCQPTAAGAHVLRLARAWALMESEALADLSAGQPGVTELAIAVNADSLATWFTSVLHACLDWPQVRLRLEIQNEDFSQQLLRTGQVLAAVTTSSTPVQGCTAQTLGVMRYLPVATPAFLSRWRTKKGFDWKGAPVIFFDTDDDMVDPLLARHRVVTPPPAHHIPSSEAYLEAVLAGLGWGMISQTQLGNLIREGELDVISPREALEVRLYWQRWKLDSPILDRLTYLVRQAAQVLGA